MKINYRGRVITVVVLMHEPKDTFQPYLFTGPEIEKAYGEPLPNGTWVPASEYTIVSEE